MGFTIAKVSEIAENYTNIHKSHGIALLGDEWTMFHNGKKIIDIDDLRLLDFQKSNCESITKEAMKEKMISWVYDSRNKNPTARRDFIYEKMKKMFPSANLLVSIRSTQKKTSWCISGHKAFALFEDYGGFDVITCLF